MTAARPRRIALTGGIATGKSRCLAAFRTLGAPTIDADVLARDVVAKGTTGWQAILDRFGPGVFSEAGELNRAALGAIVFADSLARHDLEGIVHPRVYRAIDQWFRQLDAPLGIADVPLLFESGHESDFDVVLVAACRADQQLTRLMARSHLSRAEAQARIEAQLPLAGKVSKADYVIDTSGSLDDTDANTRRVWDALRTSGL